MLAAPSMLLTVKVTFPDKPLTRNTGAVGTPVKATGNDREIFELSDLRDQLENMVRKTKNTTQTTKSIFTKQTKIII